MESHFSFPSKIIFCNNRERDFNSWECLDRVVERNVSSVGRQVLLAMLLLHAIVEPVFPAEHVVYVS